MRGRGSGCTMCIVLDMCDHKADQFEGWRHVMIWYSANTASDTWITTWQAHTSRMKPNTSSISTWVRPSHRCSHPRLSSIAARTLWLLPDRENIKYFKTSLLWWQLLAVMLHCAVRQRLFLRQVRWPFCSSNQGEDMALTACLPIHFSILKYINCSPIHTERQTTSIGS